MRERIRGRIEDGHTETGAVVPMPKGVVFKSARSRGGTLLRYPRPLNLPDIVAKVAGACLVTELAACTDGPLLVALDLAAFTLLASATRLGPILF